MFNIYKETFSISVTFFNKKFFVTHAKIFKLPFYLNITIKFCNLTYKSKKLCYQIKLKYKLIFTVSVFIISLYTSSVQKTLQMSSYAFFKG
eukprot:UN32503